jgi:tryptophan-rich sensory protein
MASETNWGIPIWLILFVVAGMLLFALKISSENNTSENQKPWSGSLRLFLLIATVLFTLAGIVDFVVWVQPSLGQPSRELRAQLVALQKKWCGREELNLHGF